MTTDTFTALYDAHYSDVLRFVRRRAHPLVVDDIVGETFLAAWRRRAELPADSFLCLVGSDSLGMWETITDPSTPGPSPAPDGVTPDSQGTHGESTSMFGYAEGLVGPSVSGVTLVANGTVVTATVEAGRWTAWWPTTDASELSGNLTITTTDGTAHTAPAAGLEH